MIAVKELEGFLPHRSPMVWIDYVIPSIGDSGECVVVLDESKMYFTKGELRQSSYIELMAQSFGFINAHREQLAGRTEMLDQAFLVGFDKVFYEDAMPKVGDKLIVSVTLNRQVGPVSYINGVITNEDKSVKYCSATLKLFSN
ncbi:hypothetical protein A9Q84_01275 [Halobacteriovorax marinus]|uniref:Beta-hydroxyacyl-ACP dehydratase n=1 Tax=Halobacteriovorax marinus TaxID=97084 RepID=A0A1Y5FHM4_9BACT|nr:hypothetical protein A9Q84_01275 [Halobacteriovorax marinus]